ncbi:hypothetical protein J416_10531 [Gracilibacillus halophilus YIM-C55.5]|uniref:VWFA domain-containing protein n=1 Tax=Gracilibacillus halophilus YIM-C55.5 TaxID=1308866 RepID=N4WJU1_9BACI|nr:hypothetical protein J416_10531 [Gracilibacillus halophilus YIM-C55.5]
MFLLISTAIVIAVSTADLFLSPHKNEWSVKRTSPRETERYQGEQLSITVTNHSAFSMHVRFVDDLPRSFQPSYPNNIFIPKQRAATIEYQVWPQVRGKYSINYLYIRYTSMIGLWEKQVTISQPDTIKVIPNLSETKRYLASAQTYLLHEGLKIRKMKSGTGEFSKVRNYVVGDDPRKINWRQSAKFQEIMTNEFEPEHGKHITICIDCGRMMGVELEEGNRLEKSVEAAITLAAAALDNGDYVAVVVFSKEIQAVAPAGKGLQHLDTILQTIYAVQVDAQESNYPLAIQYAQTLQQKRSMIVLFSDVATFVHEDHHLFYMKQLRKRHLFLMLGIEDRLLQKTISQTPETTAIAMRKSIAQKQYLYQKQVMTKWEKHGLPMLEAPADQLAVTAVSHYIQTLNRGLL